MTQTESLSDIRVEKRYDECLAGCRRQGRKGPEQQQTPVAQQFGAFPANNNLRSFFNRVFDMFFNFFNTLFVDQRSLIHTIIEAIADPLTHLIRNSIDHGVEVPADRRAKGKPEKGRVELRAFHEAGKVVISITDDGAGITPEDQGRVFDRFFTTERDRGGTGLGLSIVKASAEQSGGSVKIESGPEGTTVTVVLGPASA